MNFLFVLFFLFPCSFSRQKIVGGNVVSPSAAITWQVGFTLKSAPNSNNLNFLCGGVLLSSTQILTAAHCFWSLLQKDAQFTLSTTLAQVGISRQNSNGSYYISRVVIHPNYPVLQSNRVDLAVVSLTQSAQLNDQIKPISFCKSREQCEFNGANYLITGYGDTNPNTNIFSQGSSPSSNLMAANVVYANTANCSSVWTANGLGPFISNNFCAGSINNIDGVGTCFGDSGGPAVLNLNGQNILAGITSTSTVPATSTSLNLCGAAGQYSVFVSVGATASWISSVLAGNLSGAYVFTADCVATNSCKIAAAGGDPGTLPGTCPFLNFQCQPWYNYVFFFLGLCFFLPLCLGFVIFLIVRSRRHRVLQVVKNAEFLAAVTPLESDMLWLRRMSEAKAKEEKKADDESVASAIDEDSMAEAYSEEKKDEQYQI